MSPPAVPTSPAEETALPTKTAEAPAAAPESTAVPTAAAPKAAEGAAEEPATSPAAGACRAPRVTTVASMAKWLACHDHVSGMRWPDVLPTQSTRARARPPRASCAGCVSASRTIERRGHERRCARGQRRSLWASAERVRHRPCGAVGLQRNPGIFARKCLARSLLWLGPNVPVLEPLLSLLQCEGQLLRDEHLPLLVL